MKVEKLYKVIVAPLVTEKSTYAAEKNNQLNFKVAPWATKKEIAAAIKELFNVTPLSVNTIAVKGKVKKFKGTIGATKNWKKALVRLPLGQDINVLDFE